MKPIDFLGIPKNIDLDNLDDSIVKTPKKEQSEARVLPREPVAPFLNFDEEEDSGSE